MRTFYNSVHKIRPRGADKYVGFSNYVTLFTADPIFFTAVKNTMIWAGISPFLDVGVGLLLALLLYAKVPFARMFRVAWFTPVLISYVVVAIMWMWIYNYDWGAVNLLLRWVGLGSWATAWLGTPDTALWALIVTHSWKWAGFNMVVCLAALHSLPREVIEAAELDNCGWREEARLRHRADDQGDIAEPHDPVLHRQDEDLRSCVDHDARRSAVVDRNRVDLCLQARLRTGARSTSAILRPSPSCGSSS